MIPRHCLLFLCVAFASCTRGSAPSVDSASVSDLPAQAVTPPNAESGAAGATSSACPRTGRWALCSLEKRLTQSGFVVRRVDGEAPRRAGFSVPPTAYTLGHSRLEVFVYPDEAALARDVARIDTVTVSPRGKPNAWWATPTFVRSANMVAVFLTDSPVQAERLTLAITAGAPQPN
jgi:hypothetical protein